MPKIFLLYIENRKIIVLIKTKFKNGSSKTDE